MKIALHLDWSDSIQGNPLVMVREPTTMSSKEVASCPFHSPIGHLHAAFCVYAPPLETLLPAMKIGPFQVSFDNKEMNEPNSLCNEIHF